MSVYGTRRIANPNHESIEWPHTMIEDSFFDVETDSLDYEPVGFFWNGEYRPWPDDN